MKLFSQLLAVALLSSLVLASGCDKLKGQAEQQENAQPAAEAAVAPAAEGQEAVAPAAASEATQAPAQAQAQKAAPAAKH